MADRTLTGTLLAVVVVVTAALLPALVSARPANQIPVDAVGADANLSTPTAAGWTEVPSVTVPLTDAPSTVPNANETSIEAVTVQAARTDQRLFLRLSWADGTSDETAADPRGFPDGTAVQLPVNTSNRPPIAMGSRDNLVNVWYWSADAAVAHELLAGGTGTTTQFDSRAVNSSAVYRDGRWRVVLARDLQTGAVNRTSFTLDRNVDVAFAVWNGSNMERSGQKAVSEWYTFPLGPGPSGPPYETLLWTVAGAAIVAVVVVTVLGVRRA